MYWLEGIFGQKDAISNMVRAMELAILEVFMKARSE
jgi:hypothetical protein